jgi:hypothetical protein
MPKRRKFVADGDLDATVDISHLSSDEYWQRREAYLILSDTHARITTQAGLELQFDLHFVREEQSKEVKAVKEWKRDKMVSSSRF